jgi:hypothetical protein
MYALPNIFPGRCLHNFSAIYGPRRACQDSTGEPSPQPRIPRTHNRITEDLSILLRRRLDCFNHSDKLTIKRHNTQIRRFEQQSTNICCVAGNHATTFNQKSLSVESPEKKLFD